MMQNGGGGALSDVVNDIAYGVRYCAFIDILGFSEMIGRLRSNVIQPVVLRDLLHTVHQTPLAKYVYAAEESGLRAQSMSDSLCLSAEASPAGLAHMIFSIGSLGRALLEQGFFMRGALVKGALYHDDQMVFGEALVRAFNFEQEVALYPRIIVASEVVRDLREYAERDPQTGPFKNRVLQADDGPYFIHFLDYYSDLLPVVGDGSLEDETNRIAERIQDRLEEAIDNPRHFEKVKWFAKYWNRTLKPYREVKQIEGPGVTPEAAVWG